MQPGWNILLLFADIGLQSLLKLRFCVDSGYRATGELAGTGSNELLDG
jgi:hypothetical protein